MNWTCLRLSAFLWVVLSFSSIPEPLRGQSKSPTETNLRFLDPKLRPAVGLDACGDNAAAVWRVIEGVLGERGVQQNLRGSVDLGYSGNEADPVGEGDPQSKHDFTSGIKLRRGSYPGEFEFDAQVKAQITQGKLTENLSRFRATYDHYHTPWFQLFGFANRFSDSYMGIDERYEIGLGAVLEDHYRVFEVAQDSIKKLQVDSASVVNEVLKCASRVADQLDLLPHGRSAEARKVREDFEKDVKAAVGSLGTLGLEAQNALRQRHSRVRVGLLFGFFAELEAARIDTKEIKTDTVWVGSDPILIKTDTSGVKLPVPTDAEIKFELRPTLVLRPARGWDFRLYPYFKFALFDLAKTVLDGSGFEKTRKKDDIRIDLHAELSSTLSRGTFFEDGKVSLVLSVDHFFDSVPPSLLTDDDFDRSRRVLAVTAPNSHTEVGLKIRIDF